MLGFVSSVDPMPAQPESICIVDASVRNSIEQLLDSDGLKAQSFEDAEVFLAHARSHAVSVAVLDVWMAETSGLQVQARLREVSPNTKVIVMTSRETPAIRTAALEGGAFAFLIKPVRGRGVSLPRPSSTPLRAMSDAGDPATTAQPGIAPRVQACSRISRTAQWRVIRIPKARSLAH